MGITLDEMRVIATKEANDRLIKTKEKELLKSKNNVVEPQLSRRQRNKLKKRKKKYNHQTEDERTLALEILGNPTPDDNKADKSLDFDSNLSKSNTIVSCESNSNKDIHSTSRDDVYGSGVKLSSNDKSNMIRKAHDNGKDNSDVHTMLSISSESALEMLAHWTGIPVPEDVLLYCIPMCAPYDVVKNFKFKVKISPGNMKRGKACKQAVSGFIASKMSSLRERDIIKEVPMVELSKSMLGDVKVSNNHLITKRKGKKKR